MFLVGYDDHYQQEDQIEDLEEQFFLSNDSRRANPAILTNLQYLFRYESPETKPASVPGERLDEVQRGGASLIWPCHTSDQIAASAPRPTRGYLLTFSSSGIELFSGLLPFTAPQPTTKASTAPRLRVGLQGVSRVNP